MNIDKEWLVKWQDDLIVAAKRNLRENGELLPVCFFLTEKMNIGADLLPGAMAMPSSGGKMIPLDSPEVKPGDAVIIMSRLDMNPRQMLGVLIEAIPEEGKLFAEMAKQGHAMGVDTPEETILNILLERSHMHPKDIVAMAVALMIRKTEAIAYVKIDETWTVAVNKTKGEESPTGDLSLVPNAKEAITAVMETADFERMVSVIFNRNRPRTGRIIGFEEPRVMSSLDISDLKSSGRFTHLFEQAKKMPHKPADPKAN